MISLDPKEAVLTAAKLVVLYDRALFSELIAIGSSDKGGVSTAPTVVATKSSSSSWWEGVRQWDRLIAMQQQLGAGAPGLRSLVRPDETKLKVKVRRGAH